MQPGPAGAVDLTIVPLDRAVSPELQWLLRATAEQAAFTAVPLTFALLHLLLFAFERRLRINLYFAVLAGSFALVAFTDLQEEKVGDLTGPLDTIRLVAIPVMVLAVVRLVYALFYERLPGRFWAWVAAGGALAAAGLVDRRVPDAFGPILTLAIIADLFWVFVARWGRRQWEGVWVLAAGAALFGLGGALEMLMNLGLIGPVLGTTNPYLYGAVPLLLAFSIDLARGFARARAMEADNERKTREIEEARRLQLALLPAVVPQAPGLEVAAAMQTATEVGGDYYDFRIRADGNLIIAIGDAVGHGARAGTLVAAVKSLFVALAGEHPVEETARRFAAAMRAMGLPRAHMALALAEVSPRRARLVSAGMPPVLVCRAAGGIEEILAPGMPLGGPTREPYPARDLALGAGDLLLLMSDGFAELPDREGRALGYDGARRAFAAAAPGAAGEVVERLTALVVERTAGDAPPDDVTFVVVRVEA